MATVILARHGRTTANASGLLAGRMHGVHLDETGISQAKAAGERMATLPLATIVTSPLVRCKETARRIAAQQPVPEVPLISEGRLSECDYGDWSGRELKTLAKEKLWQVVQGHPSAAAFPNGESIAQMSTRAVQGLRDWDARVTQEYGEQAVWLAVSHGDVIKAIVADALGMHVDLFQRLVVDPGSLTVLRYTPMRPFVLTLNTTSGDLGGLRPPQARGSRRRAPTSGDAAVGGGAGSGLSARR